MEIDARESGFNSFEAAGQQQLAGRHFASSEIQEKLDNLQGERGLLKRYVCTTLHSRLGWTAGRAAHLAGLHIRPCFM